MKTQFKDFSFKLAVIQVLMYDKKLLKPEYHSNVANPKQDNKMIPRVKKYFMELDIPSELLAQVTEIEQDPNNDVILELIPIWDGQGEEFVIKSTEDVKLLPNLKKVTIFTGDAFNEIDEQYIKFGEFAAKGIEAYGYGISKKGTPGAYNKIEEFKKKAKTK
ncbi:MAG: DUF6892 domain-containing protein [Bacteroidia bacterium]